MHGTTVKSTSVSCKASTQHQYNTKQYKYKQNTELTKQKQYDRTKPLNPEKTEKNDDIKISQIGFPPSPHIFYFK